MEGFEPAKRRGVLVLKIASFEGEIGILRGLVNFLLSTMAFWLGSVGFFSLTLSNQTVHPLKKLIDFRICVRSLFCSTKGEILTDLVVVSNILSFTPT